MSTVRVEIVREVAGVTISNKSRKNAITSGMWHELQAIFERLSSDEDVRAIIISGDGQEAFAAGADISEFDGVRDSIDRARHYHEELVAPALNAIARCDTPVIAGIAGYCVGGGLEIASVCDLRICNQSAQFGIPVARLGFPMAYAELQYLTRLVGLPVCAELLIEGRILNAQEAYERGLVTRVVPDNSLEDELQETSVRVLSGSPLALKVHKRQLRRLYASGNLPSASERLDFYRFAEWEDYKLGREAFIQKRKPRFTGR